MKDLAKTQIEKLGPVVKEIKILNENGKDLKNLVNSYFNDSKYFFEKGDYVRAFEAIVIVWAYIDAGLHLKAFSVPEKFKELFTI